MATSPIGKYYRYDTSINIKDLDKIIEKLYKPILLHPNTLKNLCASAIEIFNTESNIHSISLPVTVCGDIHGHFYDLLELFHVGGKVPYTNYLFLGDYVNVGCYSLEVFSLLFALKVRYKNRITLLRGSADSRTFSMNYGFYEECMKAYGGDISIFTAITDVFNYLPLSALIDNKIFCLHGGLSPHIDTLKDILELDRFQETPFEGGMCDLLWSDPGINDGWGMSPSGAGYLFGADITKTFLQQNGLKCINRSRQLVLEGYEYSHNKQLITVFSAPNYKGRCGNIGAMIEYDQYSNYTFLQFHESTCKVSRKPKPKSKTPDYFWNKPKDIQNLSGAASILKNSIIICWEQAKFKNKPKINAEEMVKLIICHWNKKISNDLVLLIIKYCGSYKYLYW